MRLEEERTDIRDVLAQCELHWLVGRIPESKVDEMRDELHLHLREATRDGKPVGSVVGDDVFAFAESWAKEDRPLRPLGRRIAEFASIPAVLVAVFATLLHLTSWEFVVQVRWSVAVLLLVTVLCCVISVAHVRGIGRPWQVSWPVIVAVSLLTVGAGWALSELTTGERDGVVFLWPWYGTVAVAAVAVVLGRFGK